MTEITTTGETPAEIQARHWAESERWVLELYRVKLSQHHAAQMPSAWQAAALLEPVHAAGVHPAAIVTMYRPGGPPFVVVDPSMPRREQLVATAAAYDALSHPDHWAWVELPCGRFVAEITMERITCAA